MTWYAAPSLKRLKEEVDAAYPKRAEQSDGFIASAAHHLENPSSDHEADYASVPPGVVRAWDCTEGGAQGADCERLVAWLLGRCRSGAEDRLQYLIWQGHIYNARRFWFTKPWAKRAYTGADKHDLHVHFSIKHTWGAERSVRPWLSGFPVSKADVKAWQIGHNKAAKRKLAVDGICGPITLAAMAGE